MTARAASGREYMSTLDRDACKHQNDARYIILMTRKRGRGTGQRAQDRLTVSLAPGHRAALEAVARKNNAPLAFVVRYALTRLITENQDRQLPLEFPSVKAPE